ncbi:MAG: EAL domain-containing protein [Burkholderiaceae bacterium]|nr:EAL domain-containing protein [Burkholderiaceae bacterium]
MEPYLPSNWNTSALHGAAPAACALLLFALPALVAVSVCLWHLYYRCASLQRQLVQSEERLSLGFEGSNAGLCDWDIAGRKMYFSPWIHRQLGYAPGAFARSPRVFFDYIHRDDRRAARRALCRHLKADETHTHEFRLRAHDGDYRWVRVRAQVVRRPDGKAIRMVGSLIDVTDRKLAEDKLIEEKELAEITLASIADAVITTDNHGRITYCNRITEQLLEMPRKALMMQSCDAMCRIYADRPNEALPDLMRPITWLDDAGGADRNLTLFRPDGTRVPVHKSVAPIAMPGGKTIGAVIVLRDVSEARRHAEQLSYQATHDELTGILNRREYERRLTELLDSENRLSKVNKEGRGYAVMYLDLDRFKIINDTCGHAAGDALIRQVATELKSRLRDGDLVGRLGGDEFGIVLPRCGEADACRIAEQLLDTVMNIQFSWCQRQFTIGVSIGVVTSDAGMSTLKEVMNAADSACYMAKEKGRNRVHLFRRDDEDLSVRQTEMEWVSHIKTALKQDRFCLHTQVVKPLHAGIDPSGRHQEVLLRMVDEQGKLVPPSVFIPAAERFDLMPQIDRWVIRHSFKALAELPPEDQPNTLAINLSGASIGDERLLNLIIEQQQETGLALSRICFEITETAAIANLPRAVAFINRLRELGCRFALDDFGVGMSSLNYLKNLPVDYVKIDGSFIREIVDNPIDRAVVESINQIAHAMGKRTIAEYVENEAIIASLKAIGVDFAQGYGIEKPKPFFDAGCTCGVVEQPGGRKAA